MKGAVWVSLTAGVEEKQNYGSSGGVMGMKSGVPDSCLR